jgi:hypothetical protein
MTESVPKESSVLSLADFETPSAVEYVFVPDAIKGKGAWIQSITAGDMIEFRESNEGPAKKTATLRLIIKSVVSGEGGYPILKDEHLGMLRALKEREVNTLGKAILKLNGYEDDAKKG